MTTNSDKHNTRDDLDPEFGVSPLAETVRNIRDEQTARNEEDRTRLEPFVQEHLKLHRGAIEWLDDVHQWIADTYDFDIAGDNRAAAVWKMSGRILGICHLIVDSLELGYTAEVTSLGRDVHEANRLLEMFLMPNEKDLLRNWLADRNIKASTIRKAERRFQREVEQQMNDQGINVNYPSMEAISAQVHGELSGAAHHRRKWVDDNVNESERSMIKGKTDIWVRRAATTDSLMAVIEESMIIVGDAFSQFNEPTWYKENVGRFLEAFAVLRITMPLS